VICVLLSAMGRFEYSAYLKYSIYLLRLLAQSHLRGFAVGTTEMELPMRLKYVRSVVLLGILAGAGICSGPAFAADTSMQKHCEALAVRFKATDMRHMSPDKLETARRQAAHGERLCKSAPEIGVKALDLALKDAGFAST
jgi:hypothetical protein